MGGQQSTASGQLYNPKEYEFAAQDSNTRYGNVKIFRKLNEQGNFYEYVCQIEKTLNIESEFQSQISHAEGRKKLAHPSLVNFINYTAEKKEEFCSTFYKVQFLYEFVGQDLKKQISLRQQQEKRYSESELWYILAQSISGFKYLKEQEIYHGDIRPYHILFTDEGELKIGEHFQQVKPLTAYNQFQLQLRNEEYYLSPEIFQYLRDKQITEVFDVAANDVFALGMTVLEAATLVSSDECYNTDDYEFNYERLNELLHEAHHHYSHAFVEFLEKMFGDKEGQKWTMEDLSEELQKLKENALVERDFVEKIEIIYEQGQEPCKPSVQDVVEGEEQLQEGEQQQPQEDEQQVVEQQIVEEQQQIQQVEGQEVAPIPGQQVVREQVIVSREETHYHREEERTIIRGNVTEDVTETHEHVKRAGHHHHHDHHNTQQQPQQEMTQQQPLLQSETYDLKEIDDRINQVLAMSRETVKKYGGARAYQAYEQYENSKGYEPVRGSQLSNPSYSQQIYTPNQNVINSSQNKEQTAPTYQSYQAPVNQSQTQQVYDAKASSGYQAYQPPASSGNYQSNYKPYQPSGSSYQTYNPASQQGSQQVEQLIDSTKKETNQVTSSYQPYQPPAAQQ